MEDFDIESLVGNILGNSSAVAPPSILAPVAAPVALPPAPQPVAAPITQHVIVPTTMLPPPPSVITINTARIPMPVFTSADMVETLDPTNFGTLVRLQTRRWHAKIKDRKASQDAARASGADEKAFESRKRLLVGADELLLDVHSIIDAARTQHYEMTSPWSVAGVNDTARRSGARMLPNTLFFEYTQMMAEHKASMLTSVAAFEVEYPTLMHRAQQKLGSSFDPTEYPLPCEIRSHFDLAFDFMPIPAGSSFKGLPQQQLDALARKLNESTLQMAENAMQDMWTKLYTAVSKMAERLSDPEKKFHYTLVDNIREAVQYVGHLNVLDDKRVEEVRTLVQQHLCNETVEVLRDNLSVRSKVAARAVEIMERMQQFDNQGVV